MSHRPEKGRGHPARAVAVGRELRDIFDYRERRIAELFSNRPAEPGHLVVTP